MEDRILKLWKHLRPVDKSHSISEKCSVTDIAQAGSDRLKKTAMNRYAHQTKLTMLMLLFVLVLRNIEWGQCQESPIKDKIISAFARRVPREWGETVKGVKTRLNTDQKVIALTFDACGGPKGSGYDAKLINFLASEVIPGTLFISGRWLDANPEIFRELAKNPLFEIENHGLNHKPCSMNGRSVYGIKGTRSVGELIDEIELNATKIQKLTGRKPKYYRPGTAHCDEVGVEVTNALGYEVVNFSVLGDAGTTYSKQQVKKALLNASPSSIVLMHMNHPESETAKGVIEAIPELRKRGFKFVKLSEYSLR
jgi:peptidoglycan/xylan/chitin deacetylase (PgdA/CDA1 family)